MQRAALDRMWAAYDGAGLASHEFLPGFLQAPAARHWELLVGCLLLDAGHAVAHSDRGPDFRLMCGGKVVWVEATAPEAGSPRWQDAIEVRAARSFRNKLKQWDTSWLDLIGADDVFVLAINTFALGPAAVDATRVAAALVPGGVPAVRIVEDQLPRVSALVHGHCDLGATPETAAGSVRILHNPAARNPLPAGALGFGVENELAVAVATTR